MVKRICPKCFTRWYSSDTSDDPWICERCNTEIPKEEVPLMKNEIIKDEVLIDKLKKRQKRLFELLTEDYYCKTELVLILRMSRTQIEFMTRSLKEYPPKGYKKLDIILKLCGGQLFVEN